MKNDSILSFAHMTLQLSQHHLLISLSFLLWFESPRFFLITAFSSLIACQLPTCPITCCFSKRLCPKRCSKVIRTLQTSFVLILDFWPWFLTELLKSLGNSWVIGAFFVPMRRSWLGSWVSSGYELVARKTNQATIRRLELSAPHPCPLGSGGHWRLS